MDKAIPCLSLEYNVPEFSDTLEKCLGKLHTLNNNYLFNYSVGESSLLAMDLWLSYNEFIKVVRTSSFIDTKFGDIYAKIN